MGRPPPPTARPRPPTARTYASNVINTQKLKSAGRRRWLHWGPRNVCRCCSPSICACVLVSCSVSTGIGVRCLHTRSRNNILFVCFVIKNQLQDIFRPDSRQRNYNLGGPGLLYSQVRVYTAILPATCNMSERKADTLTLKMLSDFIRPNQYSAIKINRVRKLKECIVTRPL